MGQKTDYSQLDAEILARIGAGKNTFIQIDTGGVFAEADRLHKETGRMAFRIIDGRLQALKRKGVIVYGTCTGWQLTEAAHK